MELRMFWSHTDLVSTVALLLLFVELEQVRDASGLAYKMYVTS